MELNQLVAAVQNTGIAFATMRPPGSPFAILERRVVVTGPTELVELTGMGDVHVLDELVNLLREPERAWAAVVVLAAMTRREEKIVDTYATTPNTWWEALGNTAYERWSRWLKETREQLVWDPENRAFIERDQQALVEQNRM